MIQSDALQLPGLSHGFFTRQGGYSSGVFSSLNCGLGSGDDRETVLRNRAIVAERLGVAPDRLLSAYQVHSADAAVVTAPWTADERPKVDALVTAMPGLGLGVLTADCGPILFADVRARVIGAAHAGWKGRAHRCHHGHDRGHGVTRRRPQQHRGRHRPDDLEGRL